MGLQKLINSLYKQQMSNLFLNNRLVFLESKAAVDQSEQLKQLAEARDKVSAEAFKNRQEIAQNVALSIARSPITAEMLEQSNPNAKVDALKTALEQAQTTEQPSQNPQALFTELIKKENFNQLDGYKIAELINLVAQNPTKIKDGINEISANVSTILSDKTLFLPNFVITTLLEKTDAVQTKNILKALDPKQKLAIIQSDSLSANSAIDKTALNKELKQAIRNDRNLFNQEISATLNEIETTKHRFNLDGNNKIVITEKRLDNTEIGSAKMNLSSDTVLNLLNSKDPLSTYKIISKVSGFKAEKEPVFLKKAGADFIEDLKKGGSTLAEKVATTGQEIKEKMEDLRTSPLNIEFTENTTEAEKTAITEFTVEAANIINNSNNSYDAVNLLQELVTKNPNVKNAKLSIGDKPFASIDGLKTATASEATKAQLREKIQVHKKAILSPEQYLNYETTSVERANAVATESQTKSLEAAAVNNLDVILNQESEIDPQIGDLSEEEIRDQLESFSNGRTVIDLLETAPFNFPNASAKAAAMISEGYNDKIDFEDILAFADGFKGATDPRINANRSRLSNPTDLAKFYREADNEGKKAIISQIILPANQLMEAMRRLRYTNSSERKETDTGDKSLEIMNDDAKFDALISRSMRGLDGYTYSIARSGANNERVVTVKSPDGAKTTSFSVELFSTETFNAQLTNARTEVTGGQVPKLQFHRNMSETDMATYISTFTKDSLGLNKPENLNDAEKLRKDHELRKTISKLFTPLTAADSEFADRTFTMQDLGSGDALTADKKGLSGMDENAAMESFLQSFGLYEYNDQGTQLLKEDAVCNKITELAQLGITYERTLNKDKNSTPEYEAELRKTYTIKNINDLKAVTEGKTGSSAKEFINFFQQGFKNELKIKEDLMVQNAKEIGKQNQEKNIQQYVDTLKQNGYPEKELEAARNKISPFFGLGAFINPDGTLGVGLTGGASIDLGHGFKFNAALNADVMKLAKGDIINAILPSIGVNYTLDTPGEGSFKTAVDFTPVSATLRAGGSVNVSDSTRFAADAWAMGSLVSVVGAGGSLGLEQDTDNLINKSIEKSLDEASFTQAENILKNPGAPTEAKFDALSKLEPFNELYLKPLDANLASAYPDSATRKDVIINSILPMMVNDIKAKGVQNADVGGITGGHIGAGIVVAEGIPMPVVYFTLDVTSDEVIYVPDFSKINAIEDQYQRTILSAQATEMVKNGAQKTTDIEPFTDLSRTALDKNGERMQVVKDKTVDLGRLGANFNEYNKELQKADVRLHRLENGKVELEFLGADKHEVEVVLDPALLNSGLVFDNTNGKVVMENFDLSKISIHQMRKKYLANKSANQGSVFDTYYITLNEGISAGRTPEWMDKNADEYAIKRPGQKWQIEDHEHRYSLSKNLQVSDGYSTAPNTGNIFKQRESLYGKNLSPEEQQIAEQELQSIHNNINTQTESEFGDITDKYNGAIASLRSLYSSDPAFKGKISELIENSGELIKIMREKSPDLNTAELNQAVLDIQDHHYSQVYRLKAKNPNSPTTAELNKANQETLKRLDQRMNFFTRTLTTVYEQDLNRLIESGKISESELTAIDSSRNITTIAGKLATKTVNDTFYGKGGSKNSPLDGSIVKFLQTPGANFNSVGREAIQGSFSSITVNDQKSGVMSQSIGFENAPLNTGLLAGTVNEYSVDSTNAEEKTIAKLIHFSNIEMIPAEPSQDVEAFLKADITTQFLATNMPGYLFTPAELKSLNEIVKDKKVDPENKAVFDRLVEISRQMENAQMNGTEVRFSSDKTGFTFIVNYETSIKSGAYAKCANLSYNQNIKGSVQVFRTSEAPTASQIEHTSRQDVRATVAVQTYTFGVYASGWKAKERAPEPGQEPAPGVNQPTATIDPNATPQNVRGAGQATQTSTAVPTGGPGI